MPTSYDSEEVIYWQLPTLMRTRLLAREDEHSFHWPNMNMKWKTKFLQKHFLYEKQNSWGRWAPTCTCRQSRVMETMRGWNAHMFMGWSRIYMYAEGFGWSSASLNSRWGIFYANTGGTLWGRGVVDSVVFVRITKLRIGIWECHLFLPCWCTVSANY